MVMKSSFDISVQVSLFVRVSLFFKFPYFSSTLQLIRERFIGFLVTLVTLGWVGHPTAAGGDLGDLCGVGGW